MTPYELLIIVAIIAVARVVLSLRPVRAGSNGKSTSFAREFLDPFIIAGIAAWILITFVARTYYIPSASMLPTLQIHDVLLVDKFEYRFHQPNRGDIVVFPPPIPTPDDFIKRVIGRPGRFASRFRRQRLRQRASVKRTLHRRQTRLRTRGPQLRHLRELRRRMATARSVLGQRSAEIAVDRTGQDSAALLLHDGRQSQRLRGFARLGLRAGLRFVRDRAAPRRTRRIYRPRIPDFLAARAGQSPLTAQHVFTAGYRFAVGSEASASKRNSPTCHHCSTGARLRT